MVFNIGGRSFGKTRKLLEQQEKSLKELRELLNYKSNSNRCLNDELEQLKMDKDLLKKELRMIKKSLVLDGIYVNPSTLMEMFKEKCKELKDKNHVNNNLRIINRMDKEITELKEQVKYGKGLYEFKSKQIEDLTNENLRLKHRNTILTSKGDICPLQFDIDKSVIKDYLVKKYLLLVDQKAPTLLLELIDNLIQELKNE